MSSFMVEEEIKFMIDVDEFEFGGKVYVTKYASYESPCSGCAFKHLSDYCGKVRCYSGDREDVRDVIFVEKQNDGDDKPVTNATKTESLDSLFNQIVLLQKENDSLVEQKEQLVNKISAKTQAINILKDKMSEKVGRVGLVLAGVEEVVGDSQVVSSDTVTYYDLKVGDIIKIYDDIREIVAVESSWHSIRVNLEYMRSGEQLWWFDNTDEWKFVGRPNK